ncbi:hypothetical protein AB6735_18645 [Mucilaginibacter sp. RCC_168]|uniref:hypothetical protein n=1 Tax=Mucilaginibacter sp. RCC_168 TaxID=3239221 RepID=UPI003524CE1F
MIAFIEDERKITITLNGDREDYLTTLKTLLFMLGNQNPNCPLKPEETAAMTNLISDMLPEPCDFMPFLRAV